VSALTSALDRSLHLSMQLKAKTHDAERADVRNMLLLNQKSDLQFENDQLKRHLHVAERGLRISRKNGDLANEYVTVRIYGMPLRGCLLTVPFPHEQVPRSLEA
jgi:hypothetical protein